MRTSLLLPGREACINRIKGSYLVTLSHFAESIKGIGSMVRVLVSKGKRGPEALWIVGG